MSDQATKLRRLVGERAAVARGSVAVQPAREKRARVLAVTSGKGGVGKTHIAVNLAVALASRGRKVMLFDADLGLANVNILLGLTPEETLADVVSGKSDIFDILLTGPAGVKVVPGASGIPFLANLGAAERERLLGDLSRLEAAADVLVIDTGAGIADTTVSFAAAADEILVLTTPEPTSMMDAYAMVKTLSRHGSHGRLSLAVNMASNRIEAGRIGGRVSEIARDYIGVQVDPIGYVVRDPHVTLALRKRTPLVLAYPAAQASACVRTLARNLASRMGVVSERGRGGFFARLKSLFVRGAV
jgi:flagellar biosynthesis protein FlhG